MSSLHPPSLQRDLFWGGRRGGGGQVGCCKRNIPYGPYLRGRGMWGAGWAALSQRSLGRGCCGKGLGAAPCQALWRRAQASHQPSLGGSSVCQPPVYVFQKKLLLVPEPWVGGGEEGSPR